MIRTYRRPGAFAVLVAAAVIGLAACSSGPGTPQVAHLGNSSRDPGGNGGGGSAVTGSGGNATKLVDEWAACMRSHGDPNQADPVIDSSGEIEITMKNVSQAMSSQAHDSTGPCGMYLAQATSVLRNGQPMPPAPSQAQEVKYAQCMRANGIPNYPDPAPNGKTSFVGTGIDLNGPAVTKADGVCAKKVGIPTVAEAQAQTERGLVQVSSCNIPPGFKPPAGVTPNGNAADGPPPGGCGANG